MKSWRKKSKYLACGRMGVLVLLIAPFLLIGKPKDRGAEAIGDNEGSDFVVSAGNRAGGSIFLDDVPAGTHFDASGLSVSSGKSVQFLSPVRFCLFSDSLRIPAEGIGYPETELLETWELPNSERYPVQLRDLVDPSISGFRVVGQQSRALPWRVMKAMWDGDALHVKGCSGRVEVTDVHWENVEDGFGPTRGLNYWSLRNAYMKYIRDDAIENDDLIPGEVVNCLIDGCFVFLSQRSEPPQKSRGVTMVRDCYVHIEPQPHDGIPGKQWRDRYIRIGKDGVGRAPGMIFKWAPVAGSVEVKNTVFRVDAISVNGPADLRFPPGKYEEVTLVWLGKGPFPARLPAGVSITRDRRVWEEARERWIERLPDTHPAAPFLKPNVRRK